jgi:hypothetical protein
MRGDGDDGGGAGVGWFIRGGLDCIGAGDDPAGADEAGVPGEMTSPPGGTPSMPSL